jgi:hypothetical protein
MLQHIREVERTREAIYAICIFDPASQRLLRTASLRRPNASILSIAGPASDRGHARN